MWKSRLYSGDDVIRQYGTGQVSWNHYFNFLNIASRVGWTNFLFFPLSCSIRIISACVMTREFLVCFLSRWSIRWIFWILESELCGDGLTFGYFTSRLLRSINFDSIGTMREHRHLVIRCLDKSAVFFRKWKEFLQFEGKSFFDLFPFSPFMFLLSQKEEINFFRAFQIL